MAGRGEGGAVMGAERSERAPLSQHPGICIPRDSSGKRRTAQASPGRVSKVGGETMDERRETRGTLVDVETHGESEALEES